MKILNTIQNLWDYCLFCPICQKAGRKMVVSVGPDEVFELLSYEKDNQFLTLKCTIRIKNQKLIAKYIINCLDNSFQFSISEASQLDKSVEKASSPYFYFYIQGDCDKCDLSYVNSNDLELDLLNYKITNIEIERETIWLVGSESKFQITIYYNDNRMFISRLFEYNGKLCSNDRKTMIFPIIDFDFSNITKAINKIKTVLVFS